MGFTLNPSNRKIQDLSLLECAGSYFPSGHTHVLQGDLTGAEGANSTPGPSQASGHSVFVCMCVRGYVSTKQAIP